MRSVNKTGLFGKIIGDLITKYIKLKMLSGIRLYFKAKLPDEWLKVCPVFIRGFLSAITKLTLV